MAIRRRLQLATILFLGFCWNGCEAFDSDVAFGSGRTVSHGRWLDNYFIHLDYGDESEDENEDENEGDSPSSSSTVAQCTSVSSENKDTATVEVGFEYVIEMSTSEPEGAVDVAGRVLEQVLVESVAEDQCGRRLKDFALRHLEVVSVSSDHDGRCEGTCNPTAEGSLSCTQCKGKVSVEHTDGSDPDAVTTNVLRTIQTDLDDGWPVDLINESEEMQDTGVEVTKVEYTGPKTEVVASAGQEVIIDAVPDDGDTSITPAGIAVIALLAFFVLCTALILWCIWRKNSDSKSRATADDNSYITSDINDLARNHSKLDVHQCTSATCRACNPLTLSGIAENSKQDADKGITFMKTKGRGPPITMVDLDYSDEDLNGDDELSGEDTGDPEMPPDSVEVDEFSVDKESVDKAVDLGVIMDDLNDAEYFEDEIEGEADNQEVPLGGDIDKSGKKKSPFWRRFGKNRAKEEPPATEPPVQVEL